MDQGVTDASHLRAFLADRDIACPVCRYNLRGLPSTSCPECGAQLDLRVGSIDLKLGPWLFCVLAVALPAGFNSILSVIAIIGAIYSAYWSRSDWASLGVVVLLTLLLTSVLIYVVKRRSKFLQRPRASQWRRAWAYTIVMALVQTFGIWLIIKVL